MTSADFAQLPPQTWLALVIGNSRLHWARFDHATLQQTWDEPHRLSATAEREEPIWIASVVPEQSRVWAGLPNARFLTLADVPLRGLYATLGIDRALAVWGAIVTWGSPVLVVDSGTALTFTGVDATHHLVGGAILPGLRLQFEAVGQKTAIFANPDRQPPVEGSPPSSPARFSLPFLPSSSRWATNTPDAIASGIWYTVMAGVYAFVQDWWRQFPESRVVITGGDRDRLYQGLQREHPELAQSVVVEEYLIFYGIQSVWSGNLSM